MRRSWSVISCSVLVGLAGVAWAWQPDTKPAKPSKTDAPAKPAEAPAQPSMEEMMAEWAKASTPGPNHEHLMKSVGVWDGKVKAWTAPDQPPSESTCVSVIEPVLGGRFTKCETKGELKLGAEPMPFEGIGLYGYNNTTQKFEAVWADNLGTLMMVSSGELSADTKTLTWTGRYTDPVTKQQMTMREVETVTGDNSMRLEMFNSGPDGQEMKMMQIDLVRRDDHGKGHGDHKHNDHGKDAGKGKK